MRKVYVVKGIYKGLSGWADTSIIGYKIYKNVMFYPNNNSFYRTVLSVDEYIFV